MGEKPESGPAQHKPPLMVAVIHTHHNAGANNRKVRVDSCEARVNNQKVRANNHYLRVNSYT